MSMLKNNIESNLTGSAWAFSKLKEMNVDFVEVSYSVSCDEIRVDKLTFHWNDGRKTYKVEDEKLKYILCKPAYDSYSRFNNEDYCDGTIMWYVKDNTIENQFRLEERVYNEYKENIESFELD